MAIPAYLWLKDDGGADIKGSVDVNRREGSIEVLGFGHGLFLPTDNNTGKITGTRVHHFRPNTRKCCVLTFDRKNRFYYRSIMGKYFYDLYPSDFIPVEHFPDLVYRLFTEKENLSTTRPWAE